MWCLILRLCNLRLPQHFTEVQTWILDNLIWQWRLYCKKTSLDLRSMEIDVLTTWCLIWPLDDLTLAPNLETLSSKLDMTLQSKGPDFKDLTPWRTDLTSRLDILQTWPNLRLNSQRLELERYNQRLVSECEHAKMLQDISKFFKLSVWTQVSSTKLFRRWKI